MLLLYCDTPGVALDKKQPYVAHNIYSTANNTRSRLPARLSLRFLRLSNIKVTCEIDGKINPYSYCNDYSFKKYATIDKEELSDFLKDSI